ncbi:MAG: serine protease [Candidatus Binatia bacterium]|nr:MAG: serine protease [Candidatus Binatia bacterium]
MSAVGFVLAGFLSAAAAVPSPAPVATEVPSDDVVYLAVVDGMINPATADFLHESIETAFERGGRALVIQLDTPGGLLESTKKIVKDLLGAPLPVVVYVAPSGAGATSAGVFITIAAHVAAMAPGTNIGAAHPVAAGGEQMSKEMREKIENFAASLGRSIAEQRGRNVEWAERAVRESVSATEREALELGVIDLVAANLSDLLRQIDGREVSVLGRPKKIEVAGARVVELEMRFKHKLLDVLANPNIAYLLMMAGVLGLYVEFTNPGLFFPGIAGGICLLLGLTALQVLPINYSGLALIVLGIALLVTELFLPTFGIIGVGGLVAFVLGSLLLFDTPESAMAVDPAVIAAAATTLGLFTLIVGILVVRAHRQRPALGREGLIGEVGEVRSVSPRGECKVFVHGEYWDAEAEGAVEPGEKVEVVGVDGLRLRVRRAG